MPTVSIVRAPCLAIMVATVASLTYSPADAQLTGAAAQPQSLDESWGLRLAPQLEEHLLHSGESVLVFGLADLANGISNSGMSLKGHGELRRHTTVVKGDAIYYDTDSDIADAYGNVHVVNNGDVFIGPEAHLKVGASEGYMTTPKYHFNMTGGSGHAQRIDIIDNEQSVVHHGTYTACQCADDPSWYVKASRFDIDNGTNTGIAQMAWFFSGAYPSSPAHGCRFR